MAGIVIIPARFGSTRFPAKILADRTGQPLVQHVVDQVRKCRLVTEVIVATDDNRVAEAVSAFGTRCVMTSPAHVSGTDRVAEVAAGLDDAIIVNVQGDEPEIEPAVVDGLIGRLQQGDAAMATAATPFPAGADPADPNLVKVVLDGRGRALYFSRSPVPYYRETTSAPEYRLHLGIYAYRRRFLLEFAGWRPTPLERAEKLEQLRALEHGQPIEVVMVEKSAGGIDTAEQYEAFVSRYNNRRAPAGADC